MGKVMFGLSVSLDSFIANKNDNVSRVFASFVTNGIESAMAKAQELAGEKNVALHGASPVQQDLKAGLLDEFHLNIANVFLGEGVDITHDTGHSIAGVLGIGGFPIAAVPAGVLGLDGWAERLIVLSNCLWVFVATWQTMKLAGRKEINR